jgi:tyrosinase
MERVVSLKSGATVTSLALSNLDRDFKRAELRFEGVTPPVESFELRAFVDEPHAGAATPIDDNPHYLGSTYLYGVGEEQPPPPPRHRAGHETSLEQKFEPTQIRLNVTDSLRTYLQHARPAQTKLTLVAVDRHGREIREPGLRFEGVSVVTT